jgi:hexosaminidase
MKFLSKILLKFFLAILGLILLIVIFLFTYYIFLERKQEKVAKNLKDRSAVTKISESKGPVASGERVLNLLPVPKKIQFTEGNFDLSGMLRYSVTDSLKEEAGKFLETIPGIKGQYSKTGGIILFIRNSTLPEQGYTLDITPAKITVGYSSRQGLYYSLVSLKVLNVNYKGKIPCAYIEDSPDLAVRGLMLDISRNKVPTLETIKQLVQLLADLKYNHFELYVEGFSFGYPSFKNLWESKETPITGEEIHALDLFCKERFIDLVPNQNSLGHMSAWLETEDYKDLAECPKGYKMLGIINMKTTLDPSDKRSIELVTRMTDDLLPNFSSSNFNVNLDEPFELGKGKSREISKKIGEGVVYLDYALKIHDLVTSKNKKMIMWADVILRHPELLDSIPKDITLLDWGYEASYPYERHCKMLQATGLNYMVCPGTNSWTSITGRTDNMLATIENATTNGVKYGAGGMVLTDWGDMGHWQYLPVSYAGYTVGGALSWNSSSRKDLNLSTFLNAYVFRDGNSVMGDLALDLGRYSRFEEIPMINMTTTQMALQFGMRDKVLISEIFDKVLTGISSHMKDLAPETISIFTEKYDNRLAFDYAGLQKFLDSEEAALNKTKLETNESILVKDEYINAIRLIKLGADLQRYIDFRGKMSLSEQKSILISMQDIGKKYLEENKRLWMLRNKPGGYDTSIAALNTLMGQIDDRIKLLDKSFFARRMSRFLEKIGSAGAVLYLKAS